MQIRYRHQEVETMPRANLEVLQLEKLRSLVDRCLNTAHYRPLLQARGIFSGQDIKSLSDLARLPFTAKCDLREAFPYGLLAVDRAQVVRLHASSGTTGIPTVIYFTKNDIDRWTELGARSIEATGSGLEDVFQNMMSYGLFTGGLGLHYAAERVGMMVIPAGGGNTQKQLKLMTDFGTTVLHVTPSYLLHIHDRLKDLGLSARGLGLKRAFVGAEPHSEDMRSKLQELFNIEVYNSYGLSEMNGPGVAFECQYRQGMHLWEDAYIMELIDPESLLPVADGGVGELVLTILDREATPILRYRTRDLTSIYTEVCPCGRTHRRIKRIRGRSDDMLIINGVNIFPSQIEEVIMKRAELGTNYQIHVTKTGALDSLVVKVELNQTNFSDNLDTQNLLSTQIAESLQTSISIKPKIQLLKPGALPVSEGKAVRVIDERKQSY
jgi:phenylacetate-CoA ligase